MTLKDITELYVWLRKNNQHTPDEVIDFVYQAAKDKFKGMAQTNAQQTQAGSNASPKPCANCKYSEFGQAHPVDCLNCIHTWYERFDKFKPRTASAC